ncbi:MAG: TIR domain-containing protein [Devosia sp.]
MSVVARAHNHWSGGRGWQSVTNNDAERAVDFARRAILEAHGDANVLGTASIVLLHSGMHYDEAIQIANTALETSPNDRVALNCAAVVNLHAGDVRRSLALSHRALELGPNDPGAHGILTAIAHANMALGDFEKAVHWAEKSHVINAEYDPTLWMLIAGHAQLGRLEDARKWLSDDNEFVRWLGGKLTARGYTVWADVFQLKGGTPFWTTIEDTLRKRAIMIQR